MKRLTIGIFSVAAIGLTACAATDRSASGADAAPAAGASADVRNAVGETRARATATQTGDSIRVRVEASGVPRGSYAAHIHAVGACTAPDFTSAGPHWNPTGQRHGKNNPAGMHKGDLPNLAVGTDGRGTMEVTIAGARLTGGGMAMMDADGAALVIHAAADDYRTDPTGNAGARMACGVFR